MSVLITGGSGFIGSNLDGDIRLSSKDCDLRDYNKTLQCFQKYTPTIILHCAAYHGNYISMHEAPVESFTDNMLINMNVLRAAKELNVKKLIAYTSVTAFPHELDKPYTEEDLYNGEPHPYTYSYAYAKRMVDVLVKTYRDQYNLDYVCVLLSNVYGPKNDFNLETATVISKLIKMCYIAKTENTDFISILRDILEEGSKEIILMDESSTFIDNKTVNTLIRLHDSLNNDNQEIMRELIFESEQNYSNILELAKEHENDIN